MLGAFLHLSRGEGGGLLPRGVVDRPPTPGGRRFIGAPAVTDYPENHLTLKPPNHKSVIHLTLHVSMVI